MRRWTRSDVCFDQLWTHGHSLYKVIGFIHDPAVVLENVKSGEQEVHVISSLNFTEYERYTKDRPEDAA